MSLLQRILAREVEPPLVVASNDELDVRHFNPRLTRLPAADSPASYDCALDTAFQARPHMCPRMHAHTPLGWTVAGWQGFSFSKTAPRDVRKWKDPQPQPRVLCVDMCIEMCKDMSIDMRKDMHICMCKDMCIDMCIDMRKGMCTDMCIDMCYYAPRHRGKPRAETAKRSAAPSIHMALGMPSAGADASRLGMPSAGADASRLGMPSAGADASRMRLAM